MMTGKKIILLLTGMIFHLAGTAQENRLDPAEVKNGNHLEKAQTADLNMVISLWMNNRSHEKGPSHNLVELYRDSLYTYFGRNNGKLQELMKIHNDTLALVDYKNLDGEMIREKFYLEVVSEEDRLKVKHNNCGNITIDNDWAYKLAEQATVIEISFRYKVICGLEIGPKLVDADYFARYEIKSNTFKDLSRTSHKRENK